MNDTPQPTAPPPLSPIGPRPTPAVPSPATRREAALRADYQPMDGPPTFWRVAEATLKAPARLLHTLHHGQAQTVIRHQATLALLCLLAFGLTVGSFAMGAQLWLAPMKIAFGVFASALLCLPSLFVFSCLAGAASSPARILGALAGMLAMLALLLLAFCPVSWIFARSTESTVFMGFLNLAFWLVALAYGLAYLRRAITLPDGEAGGHLLLWGVIFLLVSLQMSTALRPIVGRDARTLPSEKKFFLTHWGESMETEARRPRP